jgi:protein-disulfide isomerase
MQLLQKIILSIFCFLSVAAQGMEAVFAQTPEAEKLLGIQSTDVVFGSQDAKVTMIEYSSILCPACSTFHERTFPKIKEQYIDTGKLTYIYRDNPSHYRALKGCALMYYASRKEDGHVDLVTFERFRTALMKNQEFWGLSTNFREALLNIGRLGGVSEADFNKCWDDKALEEEILAKQINGMKILEVKATPTFFINGQKFQGAKSFEVFSAIIEEELRK